MSTDNAFKLVCVSEYVRKLWLYTCYVSLISVFMLQSKVEWLKVLEKNYHHIGSMNIKVEYGKVMYYGLQMSGRFYFYHENYIIVINICCAVAGIIYYCHEVKLSN